MRISITGIDKGVQRIIKKLDMTDAKVKKLVFDILKVVTDKIMAEAILRVPVDEGFLEKSFKTKVIMAAAADEFVGYVFIPANAPASDYAMYIHEGEYNLGPKSMEKNAAVEPEVGRKYLERALTENEREFGLYVYKRLRGFISGT